MVRGGGVFAIGAGARVGVDVLEEQILAQKPAEAAEVHRHRRRDRQPVTTAGLGPAAGLERGGGEHVQLQQHGAGEVQEHLPVDHGLAMANGGDDEPAVIDTIATCRGGIGVHLQGWNWGAARKKSNEPAAMGAKPITPDNTLGLNLLITL